MELPALEVAHLGQRRGAHDLFDAAAQRGARHWQSVDRAGYWAGDVARERACRCPRDAVDAVDSPVRGKRADRRRGVSVGPREPTSVTGPKIFITYRREETAAHAGRLYDAMVARFGEGNV